MKLFLLRKSIQNKYSQLLFIIVVLVMVAPMFEGKTGQIVISGVLLGTITAIIRTFNLNKRFFFLLLILVGTSFSLHLFTFLQPGFELNKYIQLVVEVIYSLFMFTALITINRKIFLEKKVTTDTILGGISVFFLIGVIWALVYSIIYSFDPNAFSQSVEAIDSYDSMLYFSFTTLTTLGYGDITPVSGLARNLANLEAVAGMMYPAIFIARLVGLYTAQETSKDD